MRNSVKVAGFAMALVVPMTPAVAAELENAAGQSCDGAGAWHFVNVQTGGAGAGTLTATFSDGSSWTVTASKVNANNQHFNVETTGSVTLLSASTNLPGRLVLSDFTCEDDGDVKK